MDTSISEQTGPLAMCDCGALALWPVDRETEFDFDLLKLKQSHVAGV